ncbi:MAG: hypothetical protein AAGF84_09185 [Planctomycetota bacterium]
MFRGVMRRWWPLAVALLGCLAVGVSWDARAADRDPGSFVWFISDTEYSAQNTQLGLTRGGAWPLVVGEFDTFLLFPVPDDEFPSNFWHNIGDGVGGGIPVRSAVSPSGNVAALTPGQPGTIYGPTGTATPLPGSPVAVTYSPGGVLITADQTGSVQGFAYNGPTNITDIAVSPFGEGGVLADDTFVYAPTGTEIILGDLGFGFPQGEGSLNFDAQGRPHIVFPNSQVFTFDSIAAAWSATTLDSGLPSFGPLLSIESDATGLTGVGYVDSSDNLMFAYWTAAAGWQQTVVDVGVDDNYQVGLDFDYDNLPVLSYVKNSRVHVAYDPIVAVPEPAVVAVAMVGLTLIKRQRD